MPVDRSPIVRSHSRRTALLVTTAALAAGLLVAGLVGLATARTSVLRVARNATVRDASGVTRHESILVTPGGRALYTLSGDGRRHQKCTRTNRCLKFWPAVTVRTAGRFRAPAGVHGQVGTWRRNGFVQLTLGGHPLYTFSFDTQRYRATGEGVHSFGGTWHVVRVGSASSPPTTTTDSTTTTTTTTPYVY